MAAYAALVSVMQIIDQIQHHPRPPISLDKEQAESLTKVVTSLQDFLECYNPHVGYTTKTDPLESRIAEAAYAAEDVIESYIVDQIHARYRNDTGDISFIEFHQDLQKVIEEMDLIKTEVVEIKENTENLIDIAAVGHAGSSRSTFTDEKVSMVGFDDAIYQMLDKLTSGQLALQVIPIVGMGGIGKTTLARNIYANSLVQQYFDVHAWSTISQDYKALQMLRQLLDQLGKGYGGNLNEDELGELLYKHLIGRRYIIVMDDMWNIEAWDEVRRFFPDTGNGSRVVITTRLSNLASQFNYSNSLEMDFLDEADSWNLFSKTVFGEEICPPELEDIGKKIVKSCKGLPLSISVIGGLLSKTVRTRKKWRSIEENLNSIVNLEDQERCLQILYMSYNNLPVYTKPCFLYMGVFPEDREIAVQLLINLWVAEGILKPFKGKSLEEVGEMYLEELVDRNLILVEGRDCFGNLLTFKIHDLLRDISLREARKLKFLGVMIERSYHNVPQRRIGGISNSPSILLLSVESPSNVRSLIGIFPHTSSYEFRLLRVSMCANPDFEEKPSAEHEEVLVCVANLRHLTVDVGASFFSRMPSSASLLWNLQAVGLTNASNDYIFEIWKMPQLRHVHVDEGLDGTYCFPDRLFMSLNVDEGVLENLQTLLTVYNLNFGEGVVKRIPNIIRLHLVYNETSTSDSTGDDYYCLGNLSRLQKLKALSLKYSCNIQQNRFMHSVTFPYCLKELTLEETKLLWEDMQTKIGSLPLLQALHLKANSVIGSEWETVEGQFSSLVFLKIENCVDLKYWTTEDTHFPRLEYLELRNLTGLSEIPLCIGDIPTLRLIELEGCSDSAVDSARGIQEEQESFGNEDLQIHIS